MDNSSHNYVFGEGGTGIRILLAMYHYLTCRAYALLEAAGGNLHLIYETMDSAGEELEALLKSLKRDTGIDFRKPSYFFKFLKLAERVKAMLAQDKEMTLDKLAPEYYQNKLLLTKEQLLRNILGGYYGDLTLGSVISDAAMQCALSTKEDQAAGFQAIIEDVIASNNTYEVRVVFAGSGIGGEGRTNLCSHPAMLKRRCIQRVMEELRMQEAQAKAYVERVLKISVVMVGGAFRFPHVTGLEKGISELVAGTLRNFPDDSAEAINRFYLLEHDCCPVQASAPAECGEQHKHAHAIELVAVAAIENFFTLDSASAFKQQCTVSLPHYSLHGGTLTNWENLGLPEEFRLALTARLRFDAALFLWIRPQLHLSPDAKASEKFLDSEILRRMFHARNARQLKHALAASGTDLEEAVFKPLKALLAKEAMFLEYLEEISLTGKNWQTGAEPAPNCGTYLFDAARINRLRTNPDIRQYGGMTGFCFDDLTACPKTETGKTEDNLFTSGLTMDRLRTSAAYSKDFNEFLGSVYELCSHTTETGRSDHYGIE